MTIPRLRILFLCCADSANSPGNPMRPFFPSSQGDNGAASKCIGLFCQSCVNKKVERVTMRKSLIIGCAVLVFAGLAIAQVPTSGNIFLGYTYNNADWFSSGRSNFNGWTGSLEGK